MDNLELFDAPAANTNAGQEHASVTAISKLPPAVAHLVEGWPQLVAAIQTAEATVARLQKEASSHGFSQYSAWQWDPMARGTVRELASRALSLCTQYAERHFGNAHGALKIDSMDARDLMEDCGALADPEQPNIPAYWHALEARFGGGFGERMARHQLARRLIASLSMEPAQYARTAIAPEIQKDGVLFHLGLYLVEKDRFTHRGYEFYAMAGEIIQKLAQDLTDACGYSGLHAATRVIAMNRGQIKLPMRIDLPAGRLTFFTNKATLLIPNETALNLRAFIDENREI